MAFETLGPLADEAQLFLEEICRRATLCAADPREATFLDQRPSDSTTATLVAFIHTAGDMLSTNSFVYVIALGFSKAFDSVTHLVTPLVWPHQQDNQPERPRA